MLPTRRAVRELLFSQLVRSHQPQPASPPCTIATSADSRPAVQDQGSTAPVQSAELLQTLTSQFGLSSCSARCWYSSWAGASPRAGPTGQFAARSSCSGPVEYVQGQSPGPRLREYFYYIDHQGMLFLDDARMKNFTSCFKDTKFLEFFFRRLRLNEGPDYPQFPYVSLCGRERNYIRCDDLPVVYSHMLSPSSPQQPTLLRYNHGSPDMVSNFCPSAVIMEVASGRVYHPAPVALQPVTRVALVHTKLALQLASAFRFNDGEDAPPSHLTWEGQDVPLHYELLPHLQQMDDIRRHSLGLGDSG